jgi:hypothetical protein
VRLRTEEGEVVEYGGTPRTTASLERLDGPPTGRPVPRATGGDAVFDDLPPGRWQVTVVARGRAPATAVFDVRANEETAVVARFGAVARAKVRLVAPRGRRGQVRLTRGERPAHVFLDGTTDAGVTSFFAGEEGVVVGGLAPGPYVVEVLSPDLAAIGARFEAVAGQTTDVEVRPTPR